MSDDVLRTLSRSLIDLSSAGNMADLGVAIASAARNLGFVSFNITIDKRHPAEFMQDPLLTTWTREDLLTYDRDGWAQKDPLLKSAVDEDMPFLWSRVGWREKGCSEYAEYLAVSGVEGGAAIPFANGAGRLGAMTLLTATDRSLTGDALHAANVLARYSLARVQLLCDGSGVQVRDPDPLGALSGRQTEILHWVAEGKTNREIAVIMGSTLSTINYHLEQIIDKLGVTNRTSASALYSQARGANRGLPR